ncbi:efflux RND transporter periplasmic adaptor subunit [Pseudodesulfovibrio thermohalotolerans]|uniref:efflux RND transporter periplasmic adaptor subunit n=1 Tax=Pseudodesulfovibrio thermohalotolerans TaxID=2880651 RepID=UPI002440FE49|nr:efflux RND transporter periplasmic adaptor subunit [Pseudodesulfovibrio thermohalotolerans]WFS63125.1 efflux RND transporter periplasmic adaptor subunit [Pseudodesulfovibrio thermohalotolerans]
MTHLSVKEESTLQIAPSKRLFPSVQGSVAVLPLLLFCLSILAGLAGCKGSTPEAQATKAPIEVGVETLHSQSVTLTSELPGRTTTSLVADVRPQVDGIIRERLFREGSEVKEGDVLYRIEPSSYRAAYDSAMATLKKAQAALPSSENKAKRYSELIRDKAISSQDYEDAKAIYEADLAAVASAKAEVERARINLGYTEIKAPISGRIEKSNLTPGALVTANQSVPLTTIRQLDTIFVDMTQSSTDLLDLRQAIATGRIHVSGTTMPVTLKLENGTVYPHTGTLEFSEAKVDEGTGTFTVRAQFPNPERLLLPGMYVRAVIEEGRVDDCYLVPQRAVARNTKGDPLALFVNKNGKVEQRVLSVRRNVGNSWLVESGINEGDKLVVQGSQFIQAGQSVNTREMTVVDATGEVRPVQAEGTGGNAPERGEG